MLVRSRPSASAFLNRVRIYNDDHRDLSEQDCIRDMVNINANGEADQTLWIPQWKINAFPEEIMCWDKAGKGWEKGTFVVHFAGAVRKIISLKSHLLSSITLLLVYSICPWSFPVRQLQLRLLVKGS